MAGARGSANGSATGTGARGASGAAGPRAGTAARRGSAGSVDVLERDDSDATPGGDGSSGDPEPRGRANARSRTGGHAQIHSQPAAAVSALTGERMPSSVRTLTIGEAAARLCTEFPGMTVAALRRLEAAGKFTSGRSASGYRRYSEADLDLIRIVLSDQPAADEAVRACEPDPADLAGAESPLARTGAVVAAQRSTTPRTTARTARVPSSRVPAARPAGSGRTQAPAVSALFDVAPASAPDSRVQEQQPAADAVTVTSPAVAQPAPATVPGQPQATRRADRRWPDADFFTPDLGEVSLDRDQLAAAARADRAWIDGLIEYGVLAGAESAGGADLLVAKASAELARFGVEPRHLRAVAASAARVAELIAAATSTGTGRDAARRERAILAGPGRGAEAAAAAVRLHAALVRAALLRG